MRDTERETEREEDGRRGRGVVTVQENVSKRAAFQRQACQPRGVVFAHAQPEVLRPLQATHVALLQLHTFQHVYLGRSEHSARTADANINTRGGMLQLPTAMDQAHDASAYYSH